MPTSSSTETPRSIEAGHLVEILTDLNTRIARLAIALHIPLKTDADIQEAIRTTDPQPPYGVERRGSSERRSAIRVASNPERRTTLQRCELRGLLVMRFGTEIKLVELIGAVPSLQIMGSVARTLESQGLLPDSRGSLVNRGF